MPVNFFAKPCNNPQGNCLGTEIECLQAISYESFGISDVDGGDGLLQFGSSIVFVEVKNRPRGKWLKDAREKFEETILSFKEHHPELTAQIKRPVLCNPSFRGAHQNETVQKRILKDKIGLDFVRQKSIRI